MIVANLARMRGYFELDCRKLGADKGELWQRHPIGGRPGCCVVFKGLPEYGGVLVSAARE